MDNLKIKQFYVNAIVLAIVSIILFLTVACSTQNNTEDPIGKAAETAHLSIRNNSYNVEEKYEVEKFEVMVPVGEGISLKTNIIKPVGEGPWPTAFTRGPYPQQEPIFNALGEEYAKRGMAYVYQYCRGKGGSDGIYVANVDERADGKASIDWLASQNWVKNIGMHGHSYMALTTWLLSDILPEKVQALHVQSYGIYRNLSVSHSGMVAIDNICGWALQNCTDKYSYDLYLQSGKYLPNIKVDEDIWKTHVDGYSDWVNHPNFTDPYWDRGVWGDLKNAIPKINVPTAIAVGYYDHHFEGTIAAWDALSSEEKNKCHMIIGPWDHPFSNASAWKGSDNLSYNKDTDTFDWLYSNLVLCKVPSTGIDAYVIGSGDWIHMDGTSQNSNNVMKLYMTNQNANIDGKAYSLSRENPPSLSSLSYDYDPSNPKMTEGGECMLTSPLAGSRELSDPGYRDDVLSFVTDPFEKDYTISGAIKADLFVESDCEDTAFTFTVSEIDQNGVAHNIRNGLLTLGYRNNRYLPPVYNYKPNEVVELTIESLPIMWNVAAGNRIRIDISSSDYPEFSSHTNTVGNWAEQTSYKLAHQKICLGKNQASALIIPLLKNE